MTDRVTSVMRSGEGLLGYTSVKADEPFSLISLCSDAVQEAILRIPDTTLELTDRALRNRARPSARDYALRVAFWREFEKVMTMGSGRIVSSHIYAGVCTDKYFYASFLQNTDKVAWLIQPMQAYRREVEGILAQGTDRLKELMKIPFKEKGKWQPKNIELFLKAFQMVENRVHGMAVQRTENKSRTLQVSAQVPARSIVESESQIMERLRQLEAEVGTQATPGQLPATLDVEALPTGPEVIGDRLLSPEVRAGLAEWTVIDPDAPRDSFEDKPHPKDP